MTLRHPKWIYSVSQGPSISRYVYSETFHRYRNCSFQLFRHSHGQFQTSVPLTLTVSVYAVLVMTNIARSENATVGILMGENVHSTQIVHTAVLLVRLVVVLGNAIAAILLSRASAYVARIATDVVVSSKKLAVLESVTAVQVLEVSIVSNYIFTVLPSK